MKRRFEAWLDPNRWVFMNQNILYRKTRPGENVKMDVSDLDPPVERVRSHGLWAAPYATGSVVTVLAISGVFVRPSEMRPAAR